MLISKNGADSVVPPKEKKTSTNKTLTEDNNGVTATPFASKINASFKDALR
jgi:hypothetical protein